MNNMKLEKQKKWAIIYLIIAMIGSTLSFLAMSDFLSENPLTRENSAFIALNVAALGAVLARLHKIKKGTNKKDSYSE